MSNVAELLQSTKIPRMVEIRQKFDNTCIDVENIKSTVFSELDRQAVSSTIKKDMRIAITVGSRGICNIPLITKSIVEYVKSKDAVPFIIPAMGSHGGATAKGQRELIESYGVTEEYVGCQIISSLETVEVGKTDDGESVRVDKHAYEADGIIVCGRIKPHTAYRGDYESGLMKMLSIGLGKQYGAEIMHADGFGSFGEKVPKFGLVILKNAPVLFGIALIENAYDHTREIIAITPDEIILEEPKLLKRAKSFMPRILFDRCDVLIVDEIGKNISGDGMDPNISGRFPTPYATGGIDAQRVAVLDLTEETHGNACGIGLADCTTDRLFNKFDREATYPNAITNTVMGEMKIPMILNSDENAIKVAIKSCNEIDKEHPRVVRIKNTLCMESILISEAMLKEIKGNDKIEVVGELDYLKFDKNGNLCQSDICEVKNMINALLINKEDDVIVVTYEINEGDSVTYLYGGVEKTITTKQHIPVYHKVAIKPVKKGSKVIKYGKYIGNATCDINVGDHVHLHNISSVNQEVI